MMNNLQADLMRISKRQSSLISRIKMFFKSKNVTLDSTAMGVRG